MEMEEDACRWRWKKLIAGLLEHMYIIMWKFADRDMQLDTYRISSEVAV